MGIRSSCKQVNEGLWRWRRVFVTLQAVFLIFCALGAGPRQQPDDQTRDVQDSSPAANVLGLGAEEKSLLKPVIAAETWFERVTFAGGASYETLTARTKTRFTVPNLGVFGSYSERIRGPWSGGLTLWMSSWHLRSDNEAYLKTFEFPFLSVAPVRAFTHVEWVPNYDQSSSFFDWGGFKYFRPTVFAGVGYLTFMEQRGWPLTRRRGLGGEAAVRYGLGTRFILPQTFAVQILFELWRGVKTFNYSGQSVTFSLELGDVDKR